MNNPSVVLRPGKPQGFTLIEVMVATAILGIVIASVYAVYGPTLTISKQILETSTSEQTARLALSILADDLESALYPHEEEESALGNGQWSEGRKAAKEEAEKDKKDKKDRADKNLRTSYDFEGTDPKESSAPPGQEDVQLLSFTTTSSLNFDGHYPSHRQAAVSYSLVRADKGLYKLVRTERPCSMITNAKESRDRSSGQGKEEAPPGVAMGLVRDNSLDLAERIRSLTLVYLDENGKEQSGWDSTAKIRTDKEEKKKPRAERISSQHLPRLVRIILVVAVSDGRDRIYERLVHLTEFES